MITETKPDLTWDSSNYYEEDEDSGEVRDSEDISTEFSWMADELSLLMKKINRCKVKRWKCFVKNFGWRSIDGELEVFETDDGNELLTKILPDCECTFNIYIEKNEEGKKFLRIQNFHHDSPVGNEIYYIYPAQQLNL